MDPLRSDTRPAEALSGTERDARIEQLLLAGLDHYFAHQYEPAINVWTRVLFLDRTHDRARAYIERARSAQAELQRQSEAVLHQGIAAFDEGDVVLARRLVADALERGASRDEAQGMLDRIERLDAGQTQPKFRKRRPTPPPHTAAWPPVAERAHRHRGGWAVVMLAAAALGTLAVGVWGVTIPEPSTWPAFNVQRNDSGERAPLRQEPLPLPSSTETFLARGRALFATGRLHDALNELARVPIGDPLRSDADKLRGEIQRQLLALAVASPE